MDSNIVHIARQKESSSDHGTISASAISTTAVTSVKVPVAPALDDPSNWDLKDHNVEGPERKKARAGSSCNECVDKDLQLRQQQHQVPDPEHARSHHDHDNGKGDENGSDASEEDGDRKCHPDSDDSQDNELDEAEDQDDNDNNGEDDDDEEDDNDEEADDNEGSVDINERADMIASAAAALGIPIDFLVNHLGMGSGEDDDEGEHDEPVQYPFDALPESLSDLATFIQSDKCQRIIILAGAGMSVASGIPDFRSPSGLYATMQPALLTATPQQRAEMRLDPTVALEQTLFLQNPLPCLELTRDFILGTQRQTWKATLAHRFVELLHAKTGKLVRLYTQNIDGLEDQCLQLPREKVIAVHGSMDRAECAACGTESSFDSFCDELQRNIKDITTRDPTAPATSKSICCQACGAPAMKPAIVLFKSSLPVAFFNNLPDDVQNVNLLIVMGTSLRVAPANSIVWRVPRTALRVLVNREEEGHHLGMDFGSDEDEEDEDDESEADSTGSNPVSERSRPDDARSKPRAWRRRRQRRDYFAEGDCDTVLLTLMDHLGWLHDLEPLLEEERLPESSARLLREHLALRQHAPGSSLP